MIAKILVKFILLTVIFATACAEAKQEKATLVFAANMNVIASKDKGGYAELATLLNQCRQNSEPVFFIFGGGSLGPSALSSLDRGSHIIDLLNSLEPDAMTITKRDFSFLEDELSLRSYEAAFPFVASNTVIKGTQDNLDGLNDSVIIQQDQYKIGLLSILDNTAVAEYGLKNINVLSPQVVVEKKAKLLRAQGVDLVVLQYSGTGDNLDQYLENNIVDLVLQKDVHKKFKKNLVVSKHPKYIAITEANDVLILQLSWQKNQPSSLVINKKVQQLHDYEKNTEILAQVKGYSDRLAFLLDEKIGKTSVAMNTKHLSVRTQENAFANLMADAAKEYSHADISLINGGTIRGDRKYNAEQVLLRRDIVNELPFRGEILLIEISGSQLLLALEHSLSGIDTVEGRFLQVSGMKVVYNSQVKQGNRLLSVMINGVMLKDNKMYKVATTEFLAKGGDGYVMFSQGMQVKHTNQMNKLFSDIVIDYIKKQTIITPKIDRRLIDFSQKVIVKK